MKKLICAVLVIATLSALATAAVSANAASTDSLTYDIETELRWMGRTYARNSMHHFNWSSSGFECRFVGSGVTARLCSNAPGGNNTAYIKIYIDGVEQPDVALTAISQTIVLAENLDPTVEHTVKVVKRTNARSSTAALISLTLHDGEKLAPPSDSPRYIEFLGDSLTVGYSTVPFADQTEWSTAGEDSTKTYNEPAANAFFADYSIVAISGRGIVRNTGGGTDKLFPAIYSFIDQYNNPGVKYKFERQPDVIVINLGSNDASSANDDLTPEEFRAGLKKFLLKVRQNNPKAEIIYTYGLIKTRLSEDIEAVIAQLRADGDDHISYIQLKQCNSDEYFLGHPTAQAYADRTQSIIDAIAEATGWIPYNEADLNRPKESEETTPVEAEPVDTTTPKETEPAVTDILVDNSGCGAALLPSVMLTALTAAGATLIKKKKRK